MGWFFGQTWLSSFGEIEKLRPEWLTRLCPVVKQLCFARKQVLQLIWQTRCSFSSCFCNFSATFQWIHCTCCSKSAVASRKLEISLSALLISKLALCWLRHLNCLLICTNETFKFMKMFSRRNCLFFLQKLNGTLHHRQRVPKAVTQEEHLWHWRDFGWNANAAIIVDYRNYIVYGIEISNFHSHKSTNVNA